MDDSPVNQGRCVSCGLLCCVTKERAVQRYLEIGTSQREDGSVFEGIGSGVGPRYPSGEPACLVDAFNLMQEVRDESVGVSSHENKAAAIVVIQKDRNCPAWIEYKPGMSPREHREREMTLHEQRLQFAALRSMGRWQLAICVATLVAAIVVPMCTANQSLRSAPQPQPTQPNTGHPTP